MSPQERRALLGQVLVEIEETSADLAAHSVLLRRQMRNWIEFGTALDRNGERTITELRLTLAACDRDALVRAQEDVERLQKRMAELVEQKRRLTVGG